MQHLAEEKEIELYDYLKVVINYKYFILFLSICCGIVGYVKDQEGRVAPMRTTSFNILLSFSGIEKGEYPNGTKFNKNDIIEPNIISNAIKKARIESSELTSEQIPFLLKPYIREVIPDAIRNEYEKKEEKNQTSFEYYPTEFELKLHTTISPNLSSILCENFLESILSTWREDFQDKYVSYTTYPTLQKLDELEEYEFLEILAIIEEKIKLAIEDIDGSSDAEKTSVTKSSDVRNDGLETIGMTEGLKKFRSRKYGVNILTVKMRLENFLRFETYKMKSFLDANSVFKDKEALLRYLNLKIIELELNRSKKKAEYEFLLKMLEEVRDVKFLPLTQSGPAKEFQEFLKIPEFFPGLIDQLAKAGVTSAALEQEIKYLKSQFLKLKATDVKVSEEIQDKAQKGMDQLINKANDLFEMINEIRVEYNNEQLKDFVKKKSSAQSVISSYETKKLWLKFFAGGLIIAIFLSFFVNYLREHRDS